MKKNIYIILSGLLLLFTLSCSDKKSPALLITGQNNHDWQVSSQALAQIIENTGMFSCTVVTTPENGDMESFTPDFSRYKLVVLDYSGDPWPDNVNSDFVEYVKNGGGVIIYHSSDQSLLNDGESGSYMYYLNNTLISDTVPVADTTKSRRAELIIRTRNTDHPVTKGLPARWIHAEDELSRMKVSGENTEVLASGYTVSRGFRGQQMRELPVIMASTYGNGRIFHTALGHPDGQAMQCTGFIVTLQRGAEWAATGQVTQEVPFDFPTAAGPVTRSDFATLTLDDAIENIKSYDIGKSTRDIIFIESEIRKAAGNSETLLNIEKKLARLLQDGETTTEAKKIILRELSLIGSDYSGEIIRGLADEQLKDEVAFTLERLYGPAAMQ